MHSIDSPRTLSPSGSARVARHDVEQFLRTALGLRFETQHIGETIWWPATAFETAGTLANFYPDLLACLDRLRAGEMLTSPLASFRALPPH